MAFNGSKSFNHRKILHAHAHTRKNESCATLCETDGRVGMRQSYLSARVLPSKQLRPNIILVARTMRVLNSEVAIFWLWLVGGVYS